MTDIVKRLRDDARNVTYGSNMRYEAADEIERLRQQVQHANDHADAAIKDMKLMREALEDADQTLLLLGDTGWRTRNLAALDETK